MLGTDETAGVPDPVSNFIERCDGKRGATFRAQGIIKQGGRIIHRDGQTFPNRRDADIWGAQRNKLLQAALDNLAEHPERWEELTDGGPSVTGREIIHRYQAAGAVAAKTTKVSCRVHRGRIGRFRRLWSTRSIDRIPGSSG